MLRCVLKLYCIIHNSISVHFRDKKDDDKDEKVSLIITQ